MQSSQQQQQQLAVDKGKTEAAHPGARGGGGWAVVVCWRIKSAKECMLALSSRAAACQQALSCTTSSSSRSKAASRLAVLQPEAAPRAPVACAERAAATVPSARRLHCVIDENAEVTDMVC